MSYVYFNSYYDLTIPSIFEGLIGFCRSLEGFCQSLEDFSQGFARMMTRKAMVVCDISVVDAAIDVISELGSEMIFVTILPKDEDGTRVYLERVLEKGDPEDFRDVDEWYDKFHSLPEEDYSVSIWRS